ncbi:MAG: hypothetical protein ACI4QZ_00835, partial [Eubacteriales bacterium]
GGTGMSLTPVFFIVLHTDGKVEMLSVNEQMRNYPDPVGDVVNLIEKSPELISKLKDAFGSKKDK